MMMRIQLFDMSLIKQNSCYITAVLSSRTCSQIDTSNFTSSWQLHKFLTTLKIYDVLGINLLYPLVLDIIRQHFAVLLINND